MPLASPLRLAVAVPTLPRVCQRAGVKRKRSSTPAVRRGIFLEPTSRRKIEMRQPDAMVMRGQATRSNSTPGWRVAARLRVITYIAAASSLLLMLVLARLYPDLNRTEIPDWRPLISLADEAANRGDWYGARHLYLQVDRVAYWRQDWEGLVAAACRIHQLDGVNRPYSRALSILFRASMTAERAESRRGLVTVAKSLSLLGSDEAASAVLARIQPSWPEEAISFDNLTLLGGCSRSQHPDRGSTASASLQ